jgi:hypothetical protein
MQYWGMPSYEVCACCGYEFGNDDDPGTAAGIAFEEYLAEWTREGCQWFDKGERPANWSLQAQLDLAKRALTP